LVGLALDGEDRKQEGRSPHKGDLQLLYLMLLPKKKLRFFVPGLGITIAKDARGHERGVSAAA
jgi:hypothetical protein